MWGKEGDGSKSDVLTDMLTGQVHQQKNRVQILELRFDSNRYEKQTCAHHLLWFIGQTYNLQILVRRIIAIEN